LDTQTPMEMPHPPRSETRQGIRQENRQPSEKDYTPRPPLRPFLLLAAAFILLFLLAGVGVYVLSARLLTLVIDGEARSLRTHQTTVGAFLREVGIYLDPVDRLMPDGAEPITPNMTIIIGKARPILVSADGASQRLLTHARRIPDILTEAGVMLRKADRLFANGSLLIADSRELPAEAVPVSLRVVRARPLSIRDGERLTTHITAADTVGEALAEAGITLTLADEIRPIPETLITDGLVVEIVRAVAFSVQVDGEMLTTYARADTIGEGLAKTGIALIGLDYTIPKEDTPLTAGMRVRIVRVTEIDEVEAREIDFPTVMQPDTTLPPNETRVIQNGEKGIEERRVRVRKEDGVEVHRSMPQLVVVRPPREAIIAVGATPALYSTETPTPTTP